MKRLVLLGLLAVLASGLLTGCQGGGDVSLKDQEDKKAQLDKIAGVDSSKKDDF